MSFVNFWLLSFTFESYVIEANVGFFFQMIKDER